MFPEDCSGYRAPPGLMNRLCVRVTTPYFHVILNRLASATDSEALMTVR